MKIYRVIFESVDVEEAVHTLNINTFFDKKNALKYLERCIEDIKHQNEEFYNIDDYTIEETEESYEIYLSGRRIEQCVSIWLEEDKTYDEIKKGIEKEEENEYEME